MRRVKPHSWLTARTALRIVNMKDGKYGKYRRIKK